MFRLIIIAGFSLFLMQACRPPVRLKPSRVNTGLDSTFYAGIVEDAKSVDLRQARFLARIKVGDLGISLDCTYPDVLDLATEEVRRIGGNLLVITEHTQNSSKSLCHKIKGEIYRVDSLEGLEPQIHWHPARPLLTGDLRGKMPPDVENALPPIVATISCRIGGDYFKEAIIRTETVFFTDSTYKTGNSERNSFLLRRAQLQFDLAELHARKLKARLLDLGPDVTAITGRFRELTAEQQKRLVQEAQTLDADLEKNNAPAVLENWHIRIQAQLNALATMDVDQVVDLRKKKR